MFDSLKDNWDNTTFMLCLVKKMCGFKNYLVVNPASLGVRTQLRLRPLMTSFRLFGERVKDRHEF